MKPRPRLNPSIVNGLRQCASFASAARDAGETNHFTKTEDEDFEKGLHYLYELCSWYAEKKGT